LRLNLTAETVRRWGTSGGIRDTVCENNVRKAGSSTSILTVPSRDEPAGVTLHPNLRQVRTPTQEGRTDMSTTWYPVAPLGNGLVTTAVWTAPVPSVARTIIL